MTLPVQHWCPSVHRSRQIHPYHQQAQPGRPRCQGHWPGRHNSNSNGWDDEGIFRQISARCTGTMGAYMDLQIKEMKIILKEMKNNEPVVSTHLVGKLCLSHGHLHFLTTRSKKKLCFLKQENMIKPAQVTGSCGRIVRVLGTAEPRTSGVACAGCAGCAGACCAMTFQRPCKFVP